MFCYVICKSAVSSVFIKITEQLQVSSKCYLFHFACIDVIGHGRDGIFGPKVDQIGIKWDKSGTLF